MVIFPRTFAAFGICLFAAIVLAGGTVFYSERVDTARRSHALNCARMLGFAAMEYAHDHGNRYPDAGRWEPELRPYFVSNSTQSHDYSDLLQPPAPIGGKPRRFSLNPVLSGKALAQVNDPTNTWLFYESVSTSASASDNLTFFPTADHSGMANAAVAFGDGHAYTEGKRWLSACRSPQNKFCSGGGMPD